MIGYKLRRATNGANWTSSLDLESYSISSGDVLVICHTSIDDEYSVLCDIMNSITNFNGDDAVGLFYNETLIDAIGVEGVDPGTAWDVAGETEATKDHTLVRKASVGSGNSGDWASSAGTVADDSEWTVYDQNTWDYVGSHSETMSIRNEGTVLDQFALLPNYPNPFNPTTTISFSIPQFGLTTITAYTINGRQLETLTNEVLSIGNYSINWSASSFPSGVYLIRMESGEFTQTQKVLLVK